ncbi:MAG: DUF4259 domain-containing protein [Chloroflexi bacterium]|nr:MAG: DUF4259 domain-containing protein [Chloroflexota bacterium]
MNRTHEARGSNPLGSTKPILKLVWPRAPRTTRTPWERSQPRRSTCSRTLGSDHGHRGLTGVGAWGVLAFDNDDANDWAYDLDGVSDLSLVRSALEQIEAVGSGYLEQGLACNALAACEVLARLRGRPGYTNAYTDKVDQWVATHQIDPPMGLIARGEAAVVRILGPESELRELWEETGGQEWRAAVDDLRSRMTG